MSPLSETAAEQHLRATAFTPAVPGFVGVSIDLLLTASGLPPAPAGPRPLRHGYLLARSARLVTVSGPPSPGLDVCAERMTHDLALSTALIANSGIAGAGVAGASVAGAGVTGASIAGTGIALLDEAADTVSLDRPAGPTAGVRVALEAGTAGNGPSSLRRRWAVAQAIAPVLGAAFANSPLCDSQPTGWRSNRLAARRPPVANGDDPAAVWASQVLDAPLRERLRAGAGTLVHLEERLRDFRPPVAARGHLEIDVADRQPGAGWRVPLAVITALVDDPLAGAEALAATALLDGDLWTRAARDALTDPALAGAARSCFLSAYAALARLGVRRDLRDAVAEFTERYVLRGRCPADDILDRTTTRPVDAS